MFWLTPGFLIIYFEGPSGCMCAPSDELQKSENLASLRRLMTNVVQPNLEFKNISALSKD